MRYVLWIIAWTISQRVMMEAGIVYERSVMNTVLTGVFSVIAVLFARESKLLMTLACVLMIIWCVTDFTNGEVVNALVGLIINAVLILLAMPGKKR